MPTQRKPATATDWDHYYTNVPVTAKFTRRHTNAVLLETIGRYGEAEPAGQGLSIVEFGGANSCFLDNIMAKVKCRSYDVVDTNGYGLSLLAQRSGNNPAVRLHNQSVLSVSLDGLADVVFSVGLVEHFDRARTRQAVLAHFDVLRPGGLAIITFPMPTLLYRTARRSIEMLGMWKFPDERPLQRQEVVGIMRERGEVVHEKMLWPLVLTQYMIVARKK